ncbi:hypothetical protein [Flindersiella endophytica]
MRNEPLPYTVILGDIENYSPGGPLRHVEFQDGLHGVLEDASERAGLRRMKWIRQGTGDGELALLPADIPKYQVVSNFLYHLVNALDVHNRSRAEGHRIRLRLAVDWGDVVVNGPNFAGNAPIRVARLCDNEEFKRTLASSTTSDVALIVSDGFYNEVVRDGAYGVDPGTYRRLQVDNLRKNFSEAAWIHLPGNRQGRSTAGPAKPEPVAEPPLPTVPPEQATPSYGGQYNFQDKVEVSGAAAFGPGGTAVQRNVEPRRPRRTP